jgi:acetyltransferase-like isoleucine patch superfamily enzyme
LQGVRIDDNAVIGANAVVTRDVPADTVAVGIPARVIRAYNGGEEPQ